MTNQTDPMWFIGRTLERLTMEIVGWREDWRKAQPQPPTVDSMNDLILRELRATHEQIAGMNDRIRKMEDRIRMLQAAIEDTVTDPVRV